VSAISSPGAPAPRLAEVTPTDAGAGAADRAATVSAATQKTIAWVVRLENILCLQSWDLIPSTSVPVDRFRDPLEPTAAWRCRPHDVVEQAPGEATLLAKAKEGDLAAYEEIVVGHQATAFRVAWLITGSSADAEEAAQDAFFKAYRSLGRFRDGAPFRPWLLRIVANEARNRRRARQPISCTGRRSRRAANRTFRRATRRWC
jgi:hypothetical protein